MTTRISVRVVFSTFVGAVLCAAQPVLQERPLDRLEKMTDPELMALAKSFVDRGLPPADSAIGLGNLMLARSSMILPLIEAKIEEVLNAPDPSQCFSNKTT